MNWISLTIDGLKYAMNHKKEIAEASELGIHVLRRIEHICVHHRTDVDDLLVKADEALHKYNQENK